MSSCVGCVAAERAIVHYTQMVFHWLVQNPLSAAAVFFGGAMIAVMLYTYVHDYRMLTNRGSVLSCLHLSRGGFPCDAMR